MQDKYGEILIVLIAVIFIFVIFTVVIVFVLMFYQKKKFQHKEELLALEVQYSEQLLQSKLEVQENTFSAISQELHDNIGQLLSSTQMMLSVALRNGTENSPIVSSAQESLGKAMQDLRSLSKSLDNEWLNSFNLVENLVNESERINSSRSLKVELNAQVQNVGLENSAQVMLYRVIQEGLQNSIRHSKADKISISVVQDEKHLEVLLMDDGIGLPEEIKSSGLGLRNMQQRTKLLGGEINWSSERPGGTKILITIPVKKII